MERMSENERQGGGGSGTPIQLLQGMHFRRQRDRFVLDGLDGLTRLLALGLYHCPEATDGGLAKPRRRVSGLEGLTLEGKSLTAACVEHLKDLRSLRKLALRHIPLDEHGAGRSGCFPTLVHFP